MSDPHSGQSNPLAETIQKDCLSALTKILQDVSKQCRQADSLPTM